MIKDLYLYHATGKENLDSILEHGLLIDPPKHAYASEIGIGALAHKLFLALSAEAAEAYAEVSEAFESIIIFKVKLSELDPEKFGYDWNNRCEYAEDINSCIYEDNIKPDLLNLCSLEDESFQDINSFRKTDLYDIILDVFDYEVETNKENQ